MIYREKYMEREREKNKCRKMLIVEPKWNPAYWGYCSILPALSLFKIFQNEKLGEKERIMNK